MGEEYDRGKTVERLILEKLAEDDDNIVKEAKISIELEHHEIHEGDSYVVTATVAVGASLSISFKTNTTKKIHLVINYLTESKAHIEYKEGVTITATSGTEKTIINRDRGSSNISTVLQNKSGSFVADNKVLLGATTAGGTVIARHDTWTDKKFGRERRGMAEYILKEDTGYEILLTSDDGSKGLHIDLNWYEV